MKKLIALLMCLPSLAWSQDLKLSEQAEISVVTCGPSVDELYAAFGHSAIRVFDPAVGFDAAYNYGVFDFNQPNFYLNFAKGFLYYKLGVYDYQRFQNHYILENRYVHEQVLTLSQDQKQKLFDYLQWNALPENQSYRYDYFYDNCATRIRDVVENALGKNIITFDGSYIKTNYTIRELTDLYLTEHPWGDLGIDICLGLPMDKVASPREYMFLPDYIESGFDHASIVSDSGRVPLVKKKNIIYDAREQDSVAGLPHPLIFTSLFAIVAIALTAVNIRKRVLSTSFDVILFGASGLIGILLFFLWFFTDHNAAARNMNLLWAMPLHLIAVILFIKNPSYLRHYFLFTFIVTTVTLLGWGFLSQQLHYALIPVVVAQSARAFAQYKVRSERELRTAGVKAVV
jgi:hypothetical protein